MDVIFLSRMQFALNISFHYLFPPLSIGLGVLLVIMEGLYLKTKNPVYAQMTRFWVQIFAVIFAIGVATGLVQVFAFGTNWARFSQFVGDIFGSILGAEGIFAFFMESGFLAILLFGWQRVSHKVHFFSTIMVTLGAHFSAIWIVIANCWMQTPAGYTLAQKGGATYAVMENFWQVLNNPSTIDRLFHVLVGAWLSGAFLVISVSAYYLIKKVHLDMATRALRIGVWVAGVGVLLQLISADMTARGVAKNQPIKLAALEGVYKTEAATGIWLAGWVKPEEKRVVGIAIPGMLSLLVHRDFSTPVPGLDQFPRELWPPVAPVFHAYHGMIFLWVLMVVAVGVGFAVIKGKQRKGILWFLVLSVLFPEVANQLGWFTAEVGRQPWAVYNLLKTAYGVTVGLQREEVIFSLVLFSLIYLLIFILFLYLIDRKIKQGPDQSVIEEYRNPYAFKKAQNRKHGIGS